jgi:hypothetical protein
VLVLVRALRVDSELLLSLWERHLWGRTSLEGSGS